MTANNPPPLNIDHVTIAGASLARLEVAFARVGLVTDYGGPHSNDITHMSLLGFNDGSYIELISFIEPGEHETAFWGHQIAGNAGPCAWATRTDDITGEAQRLAEQGIAVDGPRYFNRQRPDGELVEWRLAFVGNKSPGATLPFIIQDISPRRLRVRPSANLAKTVENESLLTGVKYVVLGVNDMAAATELFQTAYLWSDPIIQDEPHFGARLAHFETTPVILAEPLERDSWLSNRLARFDDAPCAYLLGTSRFSDASRQFGLVGEENWFGHRLAWFNQEEMVQLKLGVVG